MKQIVISDGVMMCFIVAYDIPNDRRRNKVHKLLKGFGKWTQYSLFECFLNRQELALLQTKLDRLISEKEDSVRFYPLCRSCLSKAVAVGGELPAETIVFII